jgi:hypothetical protein
MAQKTVTGLVAAQAYQVVRMSMVISPVTGLVLEQT